MKDASTRDPRTLREESWRHKGAYCKHCRQSLPWLPPFPSWLPTRDWLLNYFASSAFNTCSHQPLQHPYNMVFGYARRRQNVQRVATGGGPQGG